MSLFEFGVRWDYVFEYKMEQSKSFAAVAEGIYNEIVDRTKVFVYIIFSADTATALCVFLIFYKCVYTRRQHVRKYSKQAHIYT